MTARGLGALATLLILVVLPASGTTESPSRRASTDYLALADQWTTDADDSLIIEPSGSVRIVDRHGAALDSARVTIKCWEPASNHGIQLVSTFLLTFSKGDTISSVPGRFVAGEGSRPSLCLMGVGSPFKWMLWRSFDLGESDMICLKGTQP